MINKHESKLAKKSRQYKSNKQVTRNLESKNTKNI